jgi:hypothetical protein
MLFKPDLGVRPDVLIARDQIGLDRVEMLEDIFFDRAIGRLIGDVFVSQRQDRADSQENQDETATHGGSLFLFSMRRLGVVI